MGFSWLRTRFTDGLLWTW